jgi:hypothetical protein
MNVNFSAIFIDGPISANQLNKVVNMSPDLKFVAIENYRLLQRVHVAKALYKNRFRQQMIEIYHDNKIISSVFLTIKQIESKRNRELLDFMLVLFRIFPKCILHSFKVIS